MKFCVPIYDKEFNPRTAVANLWLETTSLRPSNVQATVEILAKPPKSEPEIPDVKSKKKTEVVPVIPPDPSPVLTSVTVPGYISGDDLKLLGKLTEDSAEYDGRRTRGYAFPFPHPFFGPGGW